MSARASSIGDHDLTTVGKFPVAVGADAETVDSTNGIHTLGVQARNSTDKPKRAPGDPKFDGM